MCTLDTGEPSKGEEDDELEAAAEEEDDQFLMMDIVHVEDMDLLDDEQTWGGNAQTQDTEMRVLSQNLILLRAVMAESFGLSLLNQEYKI